MSFDNSKLSVEISRTLGYNYSYLSRIFSAVEGKSIERFLMNCKIQKIKELISDYETKMEANITDRWKADMNSDSWLSKNVRPMILIFLVVSTVLMIFIDAGTIQFVVEEKWTDLLQLVLITVIGAYFGGRSFEKSKK